MNGAVLRSALATDLPMIFRAERDYMAAVEPDHEANWTSAIDRNLELWIANLDRTAVLELGDGANRHVAGWAMWMPTPDHAEVEPDVERDVARDGEPEVEPDVERAAATLITIQVLPAYRRRGLARMLLDVVEQQARSSGARVLRLGVHERNPARSLYERAGYRFTGRDGEYLCYERGVPPLPGPGNE